MLGAVKREFQSKYSYSLLGAAWTVINPLAMIFVYTVIFSQVMRARIPGVNNSFAYGIYLCAGSLTWGFFVELVVRGQNIFLENANLLKKINIPRVALPLILLINCSVNFFIVFLIFIAASILAGFWPGWSFFAFFPVLFIQICFGLGLGIILGVLNVFFRDVGYLFGVVVQFWFWLTPIVYPAEILPDSIKIWAQFNPMYALVCAYQGLFVLGRWPNWTSLIYPAIFASVLCVIAVKLYRNHAGELVDEL